jgi:hypothetical protein
VGHSPRKNPQKTDSGQSPGIGKGLGTGDIADILRNIDFPTGEVKADSILSQK